MSIRFLTTAALAASLIAAPAFATQGFTPSNNESSGVSHPMPSSKTREEVKQQVRQAQRDGTLRQDHGEVTHAPDVEDAVSTRSRAEVQREAEQARDDRSLRDLYIN